jgi:hypothetical protein
MKIKTFEAACKKLKLNPDKVLPNVSVYPEGHQKAMTAFAKLVLIAMVLNDGWIPNWQDNNEWKYYPWFDMEKDKSNPSGFRLNGATYCYTFSDAGSRLCFKSRELAEYAGKQFEAEYRDLMVLEK